jgi:hypothetical protein
VPAVGLIKIYDDIRRRYVGNDRVEFSTGKNLSSLPQAYVNLCELGFASYTLLRNLVRLI